MRRQLILVVICIAAIVAAGKPDHHPKGDHPKGDKIPWEKYNELKRNYSCMVFFEKPVLELCYDELFTHCLPALDAHRDEQNRDFDRIKGDCDRTFCNCSNNAKPFCDPVIDETDNCDIVDRCWPNYKKCLGRWVYTPVNFPGQCRDFIRCTRSPQGIKEEDKACGKEMIHHLKCDSASACSYVANPAGPAVPPPTPAPTTASPREEHSPVAFHVFIVCTVTGGLVVALVAGVALYSRLRRRRNVVPGLSNPIHVEVADPVKWYGVRNPIAPPMTSCSMPRCDTELTAKSEKRLVVLPCRCEWCGCGERLPSTVAALPSGFTQDMCVRCYPGEAIVDLKGTTTFRCRGCEEPIETILNLSALYVDEGDASQSASMGDIDVAMCCICFSEPARVVALPCGHLSTCSTCAHRLCKPVPRRGAAPLSVEVACQCPKCRSTTSAMVVLDDDQLNTAVASSRTREFTALN